MIFLLSVLRKLNIFEVSPIGFARLLGKAVADPVRRRRKRRRKEGECEEEKYSNNNKVIIMIK